jgi:hypothetical protein
MECWFDCESGSRALSELRIRCLNVDAICFNGFVTKAHCLPPIRV